MPCRAVRLFGVGGAKPGVRVELSGAVLAPVRRTGSSRARASMLMDGHQPRILAVGRGGAALRASAAHSESAAAAVTTASAKADLGVPRLGNVSALSSGLTRRRTLRRC